MSERWPDGGLEQVQNCPVCGSGRRVQLQAGLKDAVFGIAPGLWDLQRCLGCESAFLDPRPTPGSIGLAYQGYFTHDAEDHPIVRRRGRLRTVLHDMVNGYQNARYGTSRTPALGVGKLLLPFLPSLRAAADAECRHLPQLPESGGRLLDVGCGNGWFLSLARQAGWTVQGIDFDQGAVQAARSRGLDVSHGGIDSFDGMEQAFDVITLSHVIEHVHAPLDMLARLYRLLRPGGVIWLETPNLDSAGSRRFGKAWRGLETPRHLVLFSRLSLVKALQQAGFHSIAQHWHGMTTFDVYASSEAIAAGRLATEASYGGRPPWRAVLAELKAMLSPASREFLTLTARR